MASIRLHYGKYQVLYRDPAGRQRARSFARKSDARAFAEAVETDKRRREWTDPRLARVRFRDYAARWLETKVELRPRTRMNVEGRLRNYVLPAFGDQPIGTIVPSDVRSWIAGLVRAGLAPSTVRAIYLTFGQIIATAEIDGHIPRSPLIGTKQVLPKQAWREEMHFLTAREAERLTEEITPRFRSAIYAAVYLGLRDGELWAVRLNNLDRARETVTIKNSLTQVRKGVPLPAGYTEVRPGLALGPTKTGRSRTLLIPRFLAEMLREHVATYPPTPDGFIFTASEGGPVWHRNFYGRHFKPAVHRAGLPEGLRFHDLRHTCAALLIDAGRHIEEVKQYLGHSSIRVTSDRYGHLFPTGREAMRDGLERSFELARAPKSDRDVDEMLTANSEKRDSPAGPRAD